jgi:hypothetical protein
VLCLPRPLPQRSRRRKVKVGKPRGGAQHKPMNSTPKVCHDQPPSTDQSPKETKASQAMESNVHSRATKPQLSNAPVIQQLSRRKGQPNPTRCPAFFHKRKEEQANTEPNGREHYTTTQPKKVQQFLQLRPGEKQNVTTHCPGPPTKKPKQRGTRGRQDKTWGAPGKHRTRRTARNTSTAERLYRQSLACAVPPHWLPHFHLSSSASLGYLPPPPRAAGACEWLCDPAESRPPAGIPHSPWSPVRRIGRGVQR